jgi:hypothetical protein
VVGADQVEYLLLTPGQATKDRYAASVI